jgi:hypothetical protein
MVMPPEMLQAFDSPAFRRLKPTSVSERDDDDATVRGTGRIGELGALTEVINYEIRIRRAKYLGAFADRIFRDECEMRSLAVHSFWTTSPPRRYSDCRQRKCGTANIRARHSRGRRRNQRDSRAGFFQILRDLSPSIFVINF